MKSLVLSKLKSSDDHAHIGFWILVPTEEVPALKQSLGDKFLFQLDLDEEKDEPLLKNL